jgi:hypothetical protein
MYFYYFLPTEPMSLYMCVGASIALISFFPSFNDGAGVIAFPLCQPDVGEGSAGVNGLQRFM